MDDVHITGVCSLCSRDRLFADERKLLKAHSSGDIAEHLLMLPTSSYLSKNRIREESSTDDTPLSEELIKRLTYGPLLKLWAGNLHMESVHELTTFSPFFEDVLFPLRIFAHPNAAWFTHEAYHTAEQIVRTGHLKAFRIAALRFVKYFPLSLPGVLLTLALADQHSTAGVGDVDVDSTFSDDGKVEIWWKGTVEIGEESEQDLWWSDEEQN